MLDKEKQIDGIIGLKDCFLLIIVELCIYYAIVDEEDDDNKTEKYQGLAKELNEMWNMKVTVMPIVGYLGRVFTDLEERMRQLEIKRGSDTVHITTLLKSTRLFTRVLNTPGDLLSLLLPLKTTI